MIRYTLPNTGTVEQQLWRSGQRLDAGELFALGVSHSFERETLPGLVLEDSRIQAAEKEAGTFDPLYGQFESERAALGLPVGHAHAMSEEDFKASEWYRERPDGKAAIAYTPNMTPQRARILAETYDRRRNEEQLMAQSADTLGRKALLFGASFLAQLPDPINFIPVAGSLGKGASIGRKIARGALEGAGGAALADAVIFPVANRRGEDFGFFDVAMDIAFSAAIGGGLAGMGGKFAQWREGKRAEEIDLMGRDLSGALQDAGYGADEAALYARRVVAAVKDMPDGLELSRDLRRSIGGEERANVGLLLDRASKALSDGEAFDVAAWRAELGMPQKSYPWPLVRTADLIESGERPFWRDLTLDEMLLQAERFYTDNYAGKSVTTKRGEVFFTSKGWKKIKGSAPQAEKLKLLPYIDRVLAEAEWVATEPARREKHARQGMKIHHLRSVVEYDGRDLDVRLVVREDNNGRLFYDFFNESEPPRSDGSKNGTPPESQGPSAGGDARGGGEGERGSGARLRQTAGLSGEDSTLASNITGARDNVNLELRDVTPDLTPETPLPEYRAPEPPQGLDGELRSRGIDPATGASLDEAEALRLMSEGKADAADAAALEAARLEAERVDALEEIGLSLVGCVTGGV